GRVNLTTMLAHASGEWIASDWPVCPLADMASPQRMGAALTYARRYALFTLVGIAGEDDLDAPDFDKIKDRASAFLSGKAGSDAARDTNTSSLAPDRHRRPTDRSAAQQVLLPAQSAALRDRLLSELERLRSTEEAADWAHRSLPAKNTL